MVDEIAETEVFLEYRDSNEELVAILRDADKTLFICDEETTIKLWLDRNKS